MGPQESLRPTGFEEGMCTGSWVSWALGILSHSLMQENSKCFEVMQKWRERNYFESQHPKKLENVSEDLDFGEFGKFLIFCWGKVCVCVSSLTIDVNNLFRSIISLSRHGVKPKKKSRPLFSCKIEEEVLLYKGADVLFTLALRVYTNSHTHTHPYVSCERRYSIEGEPNNKI